MNALYPTLVIKGEEDSELYNKYDPVILPEKLNRKLISQDVLDKAHLQRSAFIEQLKVVHPDVQTSDVPFRTFNTKDAIVWVDPLDGTSDYVKGNLPAVTVLIGLAIKGSSRIGIVHHPFSEEKTELGLTTFGTMEHGVFTLSYNEASSL